MMIGWPEVIAGFNPRPASLPDAAWTPQDEGHELIWFQPTSGVAAGCCVRFGVGLL